MVEGSVDCLGGMEVYVDRTIFYSWVVVLEGLGRPRISCGKFGRGLWLLGGRFWCNVTLYRHTRQYITSPWTVDHCSSMKCCAVERSSGSKHKGDERNCIVMIS